MTSPETPEWVRDALSRITDRYFDCYDAIYDLIRDERGGSFFWSWAPGRMCKLQCDFSAMISPAMFGEFMVPVLDEMSARLDHCMYHWDGPGALPHHDHLLGIEGIDALQWVPGAGAEPICDPKWWPMYHKTIEAGKKLILWNLPDKDTLLRLKKEFGEGLRQILFKARVKSVEEAEALLRAAEV